MKPPKATYSMLVGLGLSIGLSRCTPQPTQSSADQPAPLTANRSFQSPFTAQALADDRPKLTQVLYNGKPQFHFTYQAGQLATAWQYYDDETTTMATDTLLVLKAVYQPNASKLPTITYWWQRVSRTTGQLIGAEQQRDLLELVSLPGDSSIRVQYRKTVGAPPSAITDYAFDTAGFVKYARSVEGRLQHEYIRDARHNITAYRYAVPDLVGQYWFYREAIVYDDRPNPFYGLNWQYDHLVLALTPNNPISYRDFQGKQTRITYMYRPDGYPFKASVVTDGQTSTWTYLYDR